jgi:hypothetical protein
VQSLTAGSGAHVGVIAPDVQQYVFCAPLVAALLHVSERSASSGEVSPEQANPNELPMHPGMRAPTVHSL